MGFGLGTSCECCGEGTITCCPNPISETLYLTTPQASVTLTWNAARNAYIGTRLVHTDFGDDDTDITIGSPPAWRCANLTGTYDSVDYLVEYVFDCDGIAVRVSVCLFDGFGFGGIRSWRWLDHAFPNGDMITAATASGTFDCDTVSGSFTVALSTVATPPATSVGAGGFPDGNRSPYSNGDVFTVSD